jgi:acyl-CoA thioester hydrolase
MHIPPLKIQVRFSDLDILGHVNNVIYLSYFEMARIHYFTALVGPKWDWLKEGVVLVKNDVEYHIPILLHDEPSIFLFVKNIGNKSFSLGYKIMINDKLHTTGGSTLVCFDSIIQQAITIPTIMREGLSTLIENEN